MKNILLQNDQGPSDKDLGELMHEVAVEAKEKMLLSRKKLDETIRLQIVAAKANMKAKKA